MKRESLQAFFEPDIQALKKLARETDIEYERIKYYFMHRKSPTGVDRIKLKKHFEANDVELDIFWAKIDAAFIDFLQKNSKEISLLQENKLEFEGQKVKLNEVLTTNRGKLYKNDCLDVMESFNDECFDLIFSDPPFNLNKFYPSNMNDNLTESEYLRWMQQWINECTRLLKYGGSFFLWNIPKWNIKIVDLLDKQLTFRHWIAVSIKYSLPIQSRLYPSHYSLLYFCKGEKPKTFKPDRVPMDICPNCFGDLKDYGGYKNKMNPSGVNIADVWIDIPPVRHKKYKRRNGSNELSIKLLDRIIEMSSEDDDLIFDPFGGSGTTYIVSEIKNRKWIGCEIGPPDEIIERFSIINQDKKILEDYRDNINCLFTDKAIVERKKRGLWTVDTFKKEDVQLRLII